MHLCMNSVLKSHKMVNSQLAAILAAPDLSFRSKTFHIIPAITMRSFIALRPILQTIISDIQTEDLPFFQYTFPILCTRPVYLQSFQVCLYSFFILLRYALTRMRMMVEHHRDDRYLMQVTCLCSLHKWNLQTVIRTVCIICVC